MLVHAGMAHRAPWGTGPLMWLHRTAAGKFWPHCRQHGGSSCKVWALTMPVDQQQLLAVVGDPSAMQMDVGQVDLAWHQQHCSFEEGFGSADDTPGPSTAAGEDEASAGGDGGGQCSAAAPAEGEGCAGQQDVSAPQHSNATALPCDFVEAVGVVPIPVIRTNLLPAQVKTLLHAAREAFAASMQV